MFFDKINPFFFFLAFAIGLFMSYILAPKKEIIIKFPTPENSDKVTYKDSDDNCFKIKATKTECPKDQNKIKDQPIQEDYVVDDNYDAEISYDK